MSGKIKTMREELKHKIKQSIELIQKAEPLALQFNERGFKLAFSGGKDSMVIYELTKLAGVKYFGEINLTSVDPPELLSFVRKYYPDIKLNKPTIGMFALIKKKKMLPTRMRRFCCEYLKEGKRDKVKDLSVTILGIRKSESTQRYYRTNIERIGSTKQNKKQYNNISEIKHECINGKDKFVINPILEWSDKDVWDYIKENNLPYCSLYDKGYKRIGCILCPQSSHKQKQKEEKDFVKFANAYKLAIKQLIKKGRFSDFKDENEVFDWWIKGISKKTYFELKQ